MNDLFQLSDLRANEEMCKKQLQNKIHQLDLMRTSNEALEEELNALKKKIQSCRDGYETGQSQVNNLQDLVDAKEGDIKVNIYQHQHNFLKSIVILI